MAFSLLVFATPIIISHPRPPIHRSRCSGSSFFPSWPSLCLVDRGRTVIDVRWLGGWARLTDCAEWVLPVCSLCFTFPCERDGNSRSQIAYIGKYLHSLVRYVETSTPTKYKPAPYICIPAVQTRLDWGSRAHSTE